MKKNKMMRLASFLLVATLLTTSMISGTFAKYVTEGSASDSARVAKWGVEVEATDDTGFKKVYFIYVRDPCYGGDSPPPWASRSFVYTRI